MINDFTRGIRSSLLLLEEEGFQQALDAFLSDYEKYDRTAETSMIWKAWENNMQRIQNGYICSGRRLLLKWLFNRVSNQEWLETHIQYVQPKKKNKTGMLTVQTSPDAVIYQKTKKEQYVFKTDMESAIAMSAIEENECCNLIRDLVNGGKTALPLIKDAFRANKCNPLISKQDAFSLGRLLSFDLGEMEEFLMRVFQDGSSGTTNENNCNAFNFKCSNDIIQFFCFKYPEYNPIAIKTAFKSLYGDILGTESLDSPNTVDITSEIASYVLDGSPDWMAEKLTPSVRLERFLSWLGENAPFLDTVSQGATILARLLSRKCQQLIEEVPLPIQITTDNSSWPISGGSGLSSIVRLPFVIKSEHEANTLKKEGWHNFQWESLADNLMKLFQALENEDIYANNAFKTWAYLYSADAYNADKDVIDSVRKKHRGIESSSVFSFFIPRREIRYEDEQIGEARKNQPGKDRLKSILTGELSPTKSDILLLIFAISNLVWIKNIASSDELPQRIRQFESASQDILDGVTFPSLGKFYAPHYTEFAMLSSIVYSAISDDYYIPLYWYLRLITSNDGKKKKQNKEQS